MIPRWRIYSRGPIVYREHGNGSQREGEVLNAIDSLEESIQPGHQDLDQVLLLRAVVDYLARRAWTWPFLVILTVVLFWLATHIWSKP